MAITKLKALGVTDGTLTNTQINASAAIAKSKLASLDIVNADINASAAIASSKLGTIGTDKMPSGSVIQTVSLVHTTLFTTSQSSPFLDITGFSLAITPTSSSNKVLVRLNLAISHPNNWTQGVRLLRGNTSIGSQTNNTSGQYDSNVLNLRGVSEHQVMTQLVEILDSPNTTSATTYKPQIIANGGVTTAINRTVANDNYTYGTPIQSGLVLQEIKG